jgi:hypothetical protein
MLQTTPNIPWTFPDQAVAMNRYGVAPSLPATSLRPVNIMAGVSEAHAHFAANAHMEALARVENSRLARAGMEGIRNTTARSQRYDLPMSRSAVPNGVFTGSPMLYSADAGIRGGRIYTYEGQKWLANRLKERAYEYELLNQQKFSDYAPTVNYEQALLFPKTNEIDALVDQVFNYLDSANFDRNLISLLQQILNQFYNLAAALTPGDLTHFQQIFEDNILNKLIQTYAGPSLEASVRREKKAVVNTAKAVVRRIITTIRNIATINNTAPGNRDQQLANLRRQGQTARERYETEQDMREEEEEIVPPPFMGQGRGRGGRHC